MVCYGVVWASVGCCGSSSCGLYTLPAVVVSCGAVADSSLACCGGGGCWGLVVVVIVVVMVESDGDGVFLLSAFGGDSVMSLLPCRVPGILFFVVAIVG